MRKIITPAEAARLIGISRQRVGQLVAKGILTRMPDEKGVLLSEVLARKANPPGPGVKGYILHVDMRDYPDIYDAYKSTGTAAEVLKLHYDTIKDIKETK